MTVTIVGSQLGDKDEGVLVDPWGGDADIVVYYQGGDNAGHAVAGDGEEYKLLLVPNRVARGKIGVLGDGCVINPRTLLSEIDGLRERGLDPDIRLVEHVYAIMPYHRRLGDIGEETKADSGLTIGTTGRGIGPTYENKAGRRGTYIGDLLDPSVFRRWLEYVVSQKKTLVEGMYSLEADEECDVEVLVEEHTEIGRHLCDDDMAVNCGDFLAECREAGDNVMFEGAQGTLIDIDHGNYPYATSSDPTTSGTVTGTGVGPTVVGQGEVVDIVRSYLSRVGEGPMSAELKGDDRDEELTEFIREKGGEPGTVTGRPCRIGWLDILMLRHVVRISGFAGIAVNHLDVLVGLDGVKVGHAYELEGEERLTMSAVAERWGECEPVLKKFDTWSEVDWAAVIEEGYDAIPDTTQNYLEYLSDELDVPIYAAGVSPGHKWATHVENPFGD